MGATRDDGSQQSLPASPPDHSTISRTRRLFSVEAHQAVFRWVLQQLAESSLVTGKTLGIDATTLEANAALRSIVRRDTGEDYTAFLTRLAQASGVETPTAEELARFDRQRGQGEVMGAAPWTAASVRRARAEDGSGETGVLDAFPEGRSRRAAADADSHRLRHPPRPNRAVRPGSDAEERRSGN